MTNIAEKIYIIDTGMTDPYCNLALEEYLFDRLRPDEVVMFLWQNDNTVVIGQNQNAWAQCDVRAAYKAGTRIARRRSGGGAVYHDLGNLNYTFITPDDPEFPARDRSVVLSALRSNGIEAAVTGRNDIETAGRKISGTAWYSENRRLCHHGTLLISSDIAKMDSILLVDRSKWEDKGVDSVRSRVVTLQQINGGITVTGMKHSLINAFRHEYPGAVCVTADDVRDITAGDPEKYQALVSKYSSETWVFGRQIKADLTLKKKFPWGLAEIQCRLSGNIIADIQVFSDCLDQEIIQKTASELCESQLCRSDITERMKELTAHSQIAEDVAGMLLDECPQN